MRMVASLFLPHLAIERVRRQERRTHTPPEPPRALELPVDDDPGGCSVPRGGGWRPGARWARADIEAKVAALPVHQQPSIRELGRRSEAAEPVFRRKQDREAVVAASVPVVALPEHPPLVLVAQVGRRQAVTASCPAAQALGVPVGMAATHAHALVPGLDMRPHEQAGDAALLDRLALHAVRHWTPMACPSGVDGLWLDLTGAAHLHGGEHVFCRRLVRFLERLGLTARVAVAATPGAAHALARHGGDAVSVTPPNWTADAIWPLPVGALRLDGDARAACRRFGFETVGDLIPVARGPLARRLGPAAVERLDQALGRAPEPIVPVVEQEVPTVERRLLEPIGTPDAIAAIAGDVVRDLCALLGARGLGARAIVLSGLRVDGGEQPVAVGTSRATRDPAHLLRLLALKLDRIDPGFGLEAFRLTAVRAEPLAATALGAVLTGDERVRDVAGLVDRIVGRVGGAAVFRVSSVDNHVPERAQRRCDPLEEPAAFPSWKRPVRLLRRPEPLDGVIALMPDHPPKRFSWRGQARTVVAGDGPERVHGEWWRRDGEVWGCRDYFRVEDEVGHRYWIFRRGDGVDANTGILSWHLHGVFG
jgi:protein ImuB